MKITWELILEIASAIIVLYNTLKVIINIINPFTTVKEKLQKHDELFAKDHKRITNIEDTEKMMCKALLALLDHEITGNSVNKLKATKTEMQNFLIEKP